MSQDCELCGRTAYSIQEAIAELHAEEAFYDELWKKYRRDNYLAMATAYKMAAKIVERTMNEEETCTR